VVVQGIRLGLDGRVRVVGPNLDITLIAGVEELLKILLAQGDTLVSKAPPILSDQKSQIKQK
jgi:hypothetical protein